MPAPQFGHIVVRERHDVLGNSVRMATDTRRSYGFDVTGGVPNFFVLSAPICNARPKNLLFRRSSILLFGIIFCLWYRQTDKIPKQHWYTATYAYL